MKSLKNLFFLAFLGLAVSFASCGEEEEQVYKGGDNFHFLKNSGSVAENASSAAVIPIIFTKTSPKAGSVTFKVTSENAVENVDYIVLNTNNKLDFDANQYSDTILIRPIDNSELAANKVLTISFEQATESTGWAGTDKLNSTYTLTILDDDCNMPLLGKFTESTSGKTGGNNSQNIPTFPWGAVLTVSKISCDGDGKYGIDDITMGLYSGGYNSTGGPNSDGKNPAVFIVNGSSITIDESASPDAVYGNDKFSGSGSVLNDNSFTLDWTNTYGDQGKSTLTRQ